jgi:hypothetical protein
MTDQQREQRNAILQQAYEDAEKLPLDVGGELNRAYMDAFIGPLTKFDQDHRNWVDQQEKAMEGLMKRFPHAATHGFYPAHDFADDFDGGDYVEEAARPALMRSPSGVTFAPGWTGNELIDDRHARDLALEGCKAV